MTRALALIAVVVGVLTSASPAEAFSYIRTCGGTPAHWETATTWHLSSTYTLNQTSGPSAASVASEIERSFDEWTVPGCSDFAHTRGSDVAADPNGNDSRNIVGFYNTNWPWSSSTLAVTLTSTFNDCRIASADMVINADDWTWIVGSPTTWSQADLRSVVTHEAGHWLGMDHTNYSGGSLFASYSGGTAERSLTCDDTEGVCGAYPSGRTDCTNSGYCACGVTCSNGFCGGGGGDADTDTDSDSDTDADTDSDADADACSGTPQFENESEPNGWDGESDVDYWVPDDGGDFTISGSVSCGNNGSSYTADDDWFVVDFPCQGNARFELDWDNAGDLDFYIWDTSSENAIAFNDDGGTSGPAEAVAYTGQRVFARVRCWEGATANYDMLIDWSPFEGGGDADTDADSDSDSDADADSDTDADADTDADSAADSGTPGDDVTIQPGGCSCSSSGAPFGGLMLGLVALPWLRRRR